MVQVPGQVCGPHMVPCKSVIAERGVAATAMVSVRVALPVPPAFAALSVTVEVPAAVGVPEINPVVGFTDKPAGKPVAA